MRGVSSKFVTSGSYVLEFLTALQSRTGPEQGFPCVVFPHREKPVFITGFPGDENRFFPVRNTTPGKPCFHYMDGFAGKLVDKIEKYIL